MILPFTNFMVANAAQVVESSITSAINTDSAYSGSKDNVKLTMVDGRILYEDGRFNIGFDPQEIYAKSQAVVERLKTI